MQNWTCLFSDEFSTEGMELQFSQYQHQSTPVPSTDKVCSALRYRNITLLVADMNTLEAFNLRCQRQILDVCFWAHVSNAEVLQRSGLSTTGDILRHRRLSLLGRVERLDTVVPAHDALRLTVDTCDSRKAYGQLEKTAGGSPSQQGSLGCQRSTVI